MKHGVNHNLLGLLAALSIGVLMLVLPGCGYDPDEPPWVSYADTTNAPYDFFRPDTFFQMPLELREISGLTVLDNAHLMSIQDERGILFLLNAQTGAVEREVLFGAGGDYEGVERVDSSMYVLRSDGMLFKVLDWSMPSPATVQLPTGIRVTCDAEGLGYDEASHRLLIACKQGASGTLRHYREIYAFDVQQDTVPAVRAFTLDARSISQDENFDSYLDRKLRSFLAGFWDLSGFTPSGVAVHPTTGHIFVLTSGQKAIIELTPQGVLHSVWRIPDRYFPQPEGITFLPDGTLFISNEGPLDGATLLRFSPRLPVS